MTIGIFYDSLLSKGGAERVVVELANELNAEIVTSGYDPESLTVLPENPLHDLGNFLARFSTTIGCLFEAPFRFFLFRNKYTYDINIYIGFTSIYGAKKNENNIWYCLTPNRILYDLRQYKISQQSIIGKFAIWLHILMFTLWDKKCVKSLTTIVSQTQNIKKRVKNYYSRESTIIFPPVQTSTYHNEQAGDYFLAVSRLFPDKRMSLIAQAFTRMPDEKLVLVGDGPERAAIEKLADQNSNITLLSNIPEQELIELYANCRATVYMPIDEDFGLVPLEGMAAGKPCIAADEGGCRETVLDSKTGFLINPDINDIQLAVGRTSREWVTSHAAECRKQAQKFDSTHCVMAWKKLLDEKYYRA